MREEPGSGPLTGRVCSRKLSIDKVGGAAEDVLTCPDSGRSGAVRRGLLACQDRSCESRTLDGCQRLESVAQPERPGGCDTLPPDMKPGESDTHTPSSTIFSPTSGSRRPAGPLQTCRVRDDPSESFRLRFAPRRALAAWGRRRQIARLSPGPVLNDRLPDGLAASSKPVIFPGSDKAQVSQRDQICCVRTQVVRSGSQSI